MAVNMNWASCTAFFLSALVVWYLSSLPKNIYNARKTGLPMVICPVLPSNLCWLVLATTFQPQLEKLLPAFIWSRLAVTVTGWEFRERWKVFENVGSSFIIVTPGGNEIWTADPNLASEILLRRKDFLQLEIASQMMSLFGPSVTASNGNDWQRQRKLVAPILNERIMNAVWNETRIQLNEMFDHLSNSESEILTTQIDQGIRTMTINVIGLIGFGSQSTWARSFATTNPPEGFRLTFIDALLTVVNYFVIATFVPTRLLQNKIMPAAIQKLAIAVKEFPIYVRQRIYAEKFSAEGSKSLIGSLSRMLANNDSTETYKSRQHIREDEIVGNLFNFTVAGYDTTANTILYAFLLLALHPSWQSWVTEEIEKSMAAKTDLDYDICFPKMVRCVAFLFETLRLYTPVLRITRRTVAPQTLGNFNIGENSNVFVATGCLHVSPLNYGSDSLDFRPTRWLKITGDTNDRREELVDMPRSIFLPWSEGPRHCPGMKMAQVEFVATLVQVLSTWQIKVGVLPDETPESARQRISRLIAESQPRVALQLRNPEDALLHFSKR